MKLFLDVDEKWQEQKITLSWYSHAPGHPWKAFTFEVSFLNKSYDFTFVFKNVKAYLERF